jgi:CheY-like chemotaxis protein
MPIRVLAVDDDPNTTSALCRLLERHGFVVQEENSPRDAVATARVFQPDFVILDYTMPGLHGGDVAWDLANDETLSSTKVIFCSGLPETEVRSKLPSNAVPFLSKPVDANRLIALLQSERGFAASQFRRPTSRH